MAIRWTRMHPDIIPPMNFQALLDGCGLDKDTTERLASILKAKSKAKELGTGAREPLIDALVQSEFEHARNAASDLEKSRVDLQPQADRLFREIIKETKHD